jgi:hypothetical protein
MDAGKLIALFFGFPLIIYVGGVCWTRPVDFGLGPAFNQIVTLAPGEILLSRVSS